MITSRMIRMAAWSVAALLLALPAAAQRRGTVEVGAFARYTDFDNSLGMSNAIGAGARVAVLLQPRLAVELDISRSTAYTPVHARLVGTFGGGGAGGRVEALLGAGYVHNAYGGALDASDGGFTGLLGARYQVNSRLWLRTGLDLDIMFHSSSNSPFTFYNGNWALHVGGGVRLNP